MIQKKCKLIFIFSWNWKNIYFSAKRYFS